MAQHPLEPLSADEFRQTASILRSEGLVRDTYRFASIELKEPPKGEVKAWRPDDPVRRTSFAVVFNREDNKTYEATVDLTGHAVVSFEYIPDVTPTDGEYIPSVRGTQVRTDLKPLHITQPEGASFTVEGAELTWQNWTMRLGFNYREGPVSPR